MKLLTAAFAHTQRLLAGREGRARWRRLWVLAAIAGIAGAGAPPPPLGLLQAVAGDPTLRDQVVASPGIVGGLVFLALFLLIMGGFGRAFTFAFLEGILTGVPAAGAYRKYLRIGALHFAWTTALSTPLYAMLFAGEAWVAHDVTIRLTALLSDPAATPEAMLALLGVGLLKFLFVLIPWTLLTLPLMVFQYELIPAAVAIGGQEPAVRDPAGEPDTLTCSERVPDSRLGEAVRNVLGNAAKHPGRTAGYLSLRLGLQILGNSAALIATLLCLPVFALLGAPIAGAGWGLAHLLGGPSTSGGIGVLTVSVLLAAVVLYLLICGALIPVAVSIHTFALKFASDTPSPKR